MKIQDIMTRDVITVRPEASIQAAARLMVDHGVSGLPVVDEDDRLVGVLSEGDLILRQKPRGELPWWRVFFTDGERLAREYQKAVGTTVADAMTRSVISVDPDLPIESAAVILDEHRIRRVPVVHNGLLVGIVSRGDLIKALAMAGPRREAQLPDGEIEREMKRRLAHERWVSNRGIVIQARDGVVSLWGLVGTETEKAALETMARSVPGVKGVESHLLVKSEVAYHYGV